MNETRASDRQGVVVVGTDGSKGRCMPSASHSRRPFVEG